MFVSRGSSVLQPPSTMTNDEKRRKEEVSYRQTYFRASIYKYDRTDLVATIVRRYYFECGLCLSMLINWSV